MSAGESGLPARLTERLGAPPVAPSLSTSSTSTVDANSRTDLPPDPSTETLAPVHATPSPPGAPIPPEPRLILPAGWIVVDAPPTGLTLLALEPVPDEPPALRANITITEGSDAGLTFAQWQAGSEEILAKALHDYTILDREKLSYDRHPAGRRRATYVTPDLGVPVTIEQWFTATAGIGRTLTATCSTARYPLLVDAWYAAAASWRPGS